MENLLFFLMMRYRSNEPELMDNLSLDKNKLQEALQDISKVNRILGGNKITLQAVYGLLLKNTSKRNFTIMDFGCGDGAMLRELAFFLRKKGIKATLIGLDINEKSLEMGRGLSTEYPEISYRNQNILKLSSEKTSCDIILATLTMHHFTNEEILVFMRQFYKLSTLGVVVNDLHRSSLAYYLFKIFSVIFIKSPIAKNDGLISIKRGFKKKELQSFSEKLNFYQYNINWKWAFRYVWMIMK